MPQEHHFRPGFGLIVAAFGADAEHARLAGQIRSALPPLAEFIAPIPYTGLQQILDEAVPWGILAYQKALYLDALTPEVISVITAQLPRKQVPMSNLLAIPLGAPSARSRTRPPRSAAPGRPASSSPPPPSRPSPACWPPTGTGPASAVLGGSHNVPIWPPLVWICHA